MNLAAQAGHASVEVTVSVYGSWFTVEAPGAMDRLAVGVQGGSVVTNHVEAVTPADSASEQGVPPTGTYASGAVTRPSPC